MKKFITLATAVLIVVVLLVGCGPDTSDIETYEAGQLTEGDASLTDTSLGTSDIEVDEVGQLREEVKQLREEVEALKIEVDELSKRRDETTWQNKQEEQDMQGAVLPNEQEELLTDLEKKQVMIAKNGDQEVQRQLLQSSELTGAGYTAICENFNFSYVGEEEQWLLKDAIERVTLTSEQEERIAKTGESYFQRALLSKLDLSGVGFTAICENFKFSRVREEERRLLREAAERVTLTPEQVERIMTADWRELFAETLLQKNDLDFAGLKTICENFNAEGVSTSIDFDSLFEAAVTRMSQILTEEEKVQLAQFPIHGIQIGLAK